MYFAMCTHVQEAHGGKNHHPGDLSFLQASITHFWSEFVSRLFSKKLGHTVNYFSSLLAMVALSSEPIRVHVHLHETQGNSGYLYAPPSLQGLTEDFLQIKQSFLSRTFPTRFLQAHPSRLHAHPIPRSTKAALHCRPFRKPRAGTSLANSICAREKLQQHPDAVLPTSAAAGSSTEPAQAYLQERQLQRHAPIPNTPWRSVLAPTISGKTLKVFSIPKYSSEVPLPSIGQVYPT